MSFPPALPGTAQVRKHRAQTILVLGALGFVFAPFGFAAVWLGRKDLRAMAAGTMDPAGTQLTSLGRWLGMVAGIVWAIKWAILICLGVIVYFNWSTIKQHL